MCTTDGRNGPLVATSVTHAEVFRLDTPICFGHIVRVHEKIDGTSACCYPIDGAAARFSSRNRDRANPCSTPIKAGEPLPLRAAVKQPRRTKLQVAKFSGVTPRRILAYLSRRLKLVPFAAATDTR